MGKATTVFDYNNKPTAPIIGQNTKARERERYFKGRDREKIIFMY